MLDIIKEQLANFWIWVRQHWKAVIAFLLACLALSIVLAFPLASITLIAGSTVFEAIMDMELLIFLLESPIILMLAAGITALFAFVGVIAASALFNVTNQIYNQIYEAFFKPLLSNQTVVAVLIVATIVSLALVAAFAGGLWFIPAIIVAVPVVNKVMQMLDRTINPKCDFITLPSIDGANSIPKAIVEKMHYGRYSFLNGYGLSYFRCGEDIYKATWNRKKGDYFFEPVPLVETNSIDKLRAEKFRAHFPLPNEKAPNDVVYASVSYLKVDRKTFAEVGVGVMHGSGAAVLPDPMATPHQSPLQAPLQAPLLNLTVSRNIIPPGVATSTITTATTVGTTLATTITTASITNAAHGVPKDNGRDPYLPKVRSLPNLRIYSNGSPTFKAMPLPLDSAQPSQPVVMDTQFPNLV